MPTIILTILMIRFIILFLCLYRGAFTSILQNIYLLAAFQQRFGCKLRVLHSTTSLRCGMYTVNPREYKIEESEEQSPVRQFPFCLSVFVSNKRKRLVLHNTYYESLFSIYLNKSIKFICKSFRFGIE